MVRSKEKKEKRIIRKSKRSKKSKYDSAELRKKNRLRRRRTFFGTLFTIILSVGIYYVSGLDYFKVEHITVENQGAHYTNEQIISMSEAKTGVNMFRVLITPWKQNLAKDPYIKHVKVSRKLPDTIKITIEERVEKYAVAVKANTLIIDAEGVGLVFDTNSPYIRIDGLDLAEPVLGQKIKDSSKVKNTEKALGLLKTFEENQIPVVKLAFSEVLLSVSIYDKLTCKAEYDVIIENMENLKEILADLKSKNIERGTIRLGKDDYLAWSPSI